MKSKQSGATTSIEKALDILTCFTPEEPTLGVSEIARRLGLGVSTVHRLLNLMMKRDFVRQNPETSKYTLGFRVVHLASTAVGLSQIRELSAFRMVKLRDATGQTVRLHLVSGHERLCIEELSPAETEAPRSILGRSFPLYAGRASHVVLASMSLVVRQRILSDGVDAGDLTERLAIRYEGYLDRVHDDGFASGRDDTLGNENSLAVPIRNFTGAVVGSLSVDGPARRWTAQRMRRFAAEVVEEAAAISYRLGYTSRAGTQA